MNYYEVLGLSPEAEDVAVQAVYRGLMKRYHPDIREADPAAELRAKQINEAYAVLGNPDRRRAYDAARVSATGKASMDKAPPGSTKAASRTHAVTPRPSKRPGTLVSNSFIILAVGVIGAGLASFQTSGGEATTAANGASQTTVAASEPPQSVSTAPPAASPRAPPAAVEDGAEPGMATDDSVAQSFNCARADTEILRLICGDPELARADAELSDKYGAALKTSSDPRKLRATQRRWIAERDAGVPDTTRLRQMYTARLSELSTDTAEEPPF